MSEQSGLKETVIAGTKIAYEEDCDDAAHYLEYVLDHECFNVIYYYAQNKGQAPFLDEYKHKYVLEKGPEFYLIKKK